MELNVVSLAFMLGSINDRSFLFPFVEHIEKFIFIFFGCQILLQMCSVRCCRTPAYRTHTIALEPIWNVLSTWSNIHKEEHKEHIECNAFIFD